MADLQEIRVGNQVYQFPADMGEDEIRAILKQENAKLNMPNIQERVQNTLQTSIGDVNAAIPEPIISEKPIRDTKLTQLVDSLYDRGTFEAVGGALGTVPPIIGGQMGPQIATPEELITVPAGYALGSTAGGEIYDAIEVLRGKKQPENLRTGLGTMASDLTNQAKWAYAFGAIPGVGNLVKRAAVGAKDKAKELYRAGEDIGLPLGIGEVSSQPLTQAFTKVIGIFPFVGGPFKKKAALTQKHIEKVGDDILNTLGINGTLSQLGIDVVKAAGKSYKEFRDVSRGLYTNFTNLAGQLKNGNIIPTTNVKSAIKNIFDATPSFRLGGGLREKIKSTEDVVTPFLKKINSIKGNIDPVQYKELQKQINNLMKRSQKEGWDISQLIKVKKALEKDFINLASPKNMSYSDIILFKKIQEAHKTANDFFSQGMKLFSTTSAKDIAKVNPNIFNAGFNKQGTLNADELVPKILNLNSKQALIDLKKLIGPEKFKESSKAWLANAFQKSIRANPDKVVLKYDASRLANELGITGPNKLKTDTVKQLFKETGISYHKIKSFIKLAKHYDGMYIPSVSSFVARRVTLGGVGSLSVVGGTAAKLGGFIPFVMMVLGARGTSSMLSNPKALDNALILMKDQKVTLQKYMRAHSLLSYLIQQPELPEEEKKNFEIIKNNLQDEMNEFNINKINKRFNRK